MFCSVCIWVLFLVNIQSLPGAQSKAAFRIESFNDIVQNITHINSVLQEFIKNYRQLQDIYKSVELTAKDDVSEYVKKNKETPRVKETIPPATTTVQPLVTQVFYSAEHFWKDGANDDYYFEGNTKIRNDTQIRLRPRIRFIPMTSTPTTTTPTTTSVPTIRAVYSDISIENRQKETNELNESSEEVDTFNYRPKTNRLIQSHEDTGRQDVRKVIKYEKFDEDMWHSIIESRPIRYEFADTNNLRRSRRNGKVRKTAMIFFTRLKKRNNKNAKIQSQDTITKDSNSISDDVFSSELRMDTAILRAKGKFGRACFQYVVRRCFLALNEASKKVCRDYGCKKNFRSTLKDIAKAECQEEFHGQMDVKALANKLKNPELRNDTEPTISDTKDKTRRKRKKHHRHHHHHHKHKDDDQPSLGAGYLSTCYPHIIPPSARRMIESAELPEGFLQAIASAEIPNHSHEKSILRDRYERACKRESARRCKGAGKKTIATACEKFPSECNKRTKTNYKKHSNKMCMEAFDVKKKEDSYEDDDNCSSDIDDSGESSGDIFS